MLLSVGVLIIASVFPLFTFFFLRSAHKDNPGYRKDCRNLLLNGMLVGLPVFGFSLVCNILFNLTGVGDKYPLLRIIFDDLVLTAFSEELVNYPDLRQKSKRSELVTALW